MTTRDDYLEGLKKLRKSEGAHIPGDCWCEHGRMGDGDKDSIDGVHCFVRLPCRCDPEQRADMHVHLAVVCRECTPDVISKQKNN